MSVQTLERAYESTGKVLANVTPEQMDTQSPCASWNVRDLINHIVGGTFFFATIAEHGDLPSRVATPLTSPPVTTPPPSPRASGGPSPPSVPRAPWSR